MSSCHMCFEYMDEHFREPLGAPCQEQGGSPTCHSPPKPKEINGLHFHQSTKSCEPLKFYFSYVPPLRTGLRMGMGEGLIFKCPDQPSQEKKKPGRGDPSTRLCYPGNMAQYSTNLFYQPQMPQVRGKWETRSQQKKGGRREKTITCANHQPLKLLKVTCKPGQGQASDPAIALLCPVVDATVKGKEAADVGAACCYCC